MRIGIIHGYLLVIVGFVNAQNLKQDFIAINKAYQNATKLNVEMEVNMYDSYTSNKLYYNQKGKILKKNGFTYQSFDNTECVVTSEYSVFVDKESKEITYAEKKNAFKDDDISLMINLDSISMFCKKNTFTKESKTLSSYHFVMQNYYPNYKEIKIFFNSSNFLIERIVFYCTEDDISINNEEQKLAQPRIEMTYVYASTKSFEEQTFSYEKYMIKSGKTFHLKPAYKNYHLNVLSF
jgi:hypothetical protein